MPCCLDGHLAGTCPLVLHLEQYGCSGQSFLMCPGCLQWKQSCPSGALDLLSSLLFFTPSPFADLGICGGCELDTGWHVSAAGLEGWVARLVFVPVGDCCLGCVEGDDCGVFWGCVCGGVLFELCDCGVAGCGGTTDCGGVC